MDPLSYWWDGEARKGYCLLDRPHARAQLGGGALLMEPGSARPFSVALSEMPDDMLADLQRLREEAASAASEVTAARALLGTRPQLLAASMPAGIPTLSLGDRVDAVLTLARVSASLVAHGGVVQLLAGPTTPPSVTWSCTTATLRAVHGEVASVGDVKEYRLRLDAADHDALQLLCSSEQRLDEWLAWVRRNAPHAAVEREPPAVPSISSRSLSAPLASKVGSPASRLDNLRKLERGRSLSNVLSAGATSGSPSPLSESPRMRLQRMSSAQDGLAGERRTSGVMSESGSLPSATRARSSTTTSKGGDVAVKPRGSTISGWANRLRQSRSPQSSLSRSSLDGIDVFTSSLEDIMAEQTRVFPNLQIPSLLNFLAEEVIRWGGMSTEGIFRISASHAQQMELTQAIKRAKGFQYKLPPLK